MIQLTPISTRTDTRFTDTTLFRSERYACSVSPVANQCTSRYRANHAARRIRPGCNHRLSRRNPSRKGRPSGGRRHTDGIGDGRPSARWNQDREPARKRVVEGKSVSVRVERGGRGIRTKKKEKKREEG